MVNNKKTDFPKFDISKTDFSKNMNLFTRICRFFHRVCSPHNFFNPWFFSTHGFTHFNKIHQSPSISRYNTAHTPNYKFSRCNNFSHRKPSQTETDWDNFHNTYHVVPSLQCFCCFSEFDSSPRNCVS